MKSTMRVLSTWILLLVGAVFIVCAVWLISDVAFAADAGTAATVTPPGDYSDIITALLGPLGAAAVAIVNGFSFVLKHYLGWKGNRLLAAVLALSFVVEVLSNLSTGTADLQTAIVQAIALFAGSQALYPIIKAFTGQAQKAAVAQAAPTSPPSSSSTAPSGS
ncbi:MAG TPA: hypothetical protein VFK80_04720 [Limnochordia bacterium]|nr:hypothetical protein [Limnochordia bacterium]